MKLVAVTMFGIGYVLGSKAGRARYEQIRGLARSASENLEARQRIEQYGARLGAYTSRAQPERTPTA